MVVPEKSYTFASQNHIIVEHLNYKTMDELQNIQNLIYVIRGQRVMLDFDLAKIYQVETKYLATSNALRVMTLCLKFHKKKS